MRGLLAALDARNLLVWAPRHGAPAGEGASSPGKEGKESQGWRLEIETLEFRGKRPDAVECARWTDWRVVPQRMSGCVIAGWFPANEVRRLMEWPAV